MDTPTVRITSWIRTIPFLLAILLLTAAFQAVQLCPAWAYNLFAGTLVAVGYRYLVSYTLLRHQVRGLRLVAAQRFEEAIRAFEQNLAFFDRHPSLDKWRSLLFLSASRYGYREMTLLNLGTAAAQMRQGTRARQYYERVLELNPRNGAAISALNLLNAKLEDPELQAAE
jgi:tetratricopeptide (TPR) repeat protein